MTPIRSRAFFEHLTGLSPSGHDMSVPSKSGWRVTASSGDPRLAIDDFYATAWIAEPPARPWLEIDLGAAAALGGIEVYWGREAAAIFWFESSLDGASWARLCGTRHGEGGQDVFAFPPVEARFVRFACDDERPARGLEIVEINIYDPADAASVLEDGRIAVLGSWARYGSRRRKRNRRSPPHAIPPGCAGRVGQDLWNRLLGASLRRRRDLPGSRPHLDRGRWQ